jgi:2'-hydroxyisoflavone reductase
MVTRRELVQQGAALMALPALAAHGKPIRPARTRLDLLFLGGTQFIGRHQVEYALARGHRVTLFNRGRSAPSLFAGRAEILLGDRDRNVGGGLTALQGERRWDVVIDNSGYVPRHVSDSLDLLKDRTRRYLYVSTVAVYDFSRGSNFKESSPLAPAPQPDTEEVTGRTYGPLKAECDRRVQAALGPRATIVRPTYIFGPGDDTDRFTYWVDRAARGGDILAPPYPADEIQWIDVRDLCPWIIDLAERDQAGIYNAAGPEKPTNWRQLLQPLAKLSSTPVQFKWATPEILKQTGISLPLVRDGLLGSAQTPHFDSAAAMRAGLRFRPLMDTANATLDWWRAQTAERRTQSGWPTPEQEQQALRLLAAR